MQNTEGITCNILRYTIDDGPGIRTTVFMKGCPLRCLWCANPESISPLPQLFYRYSSCKKCGKCMRVCPIGAIFLDEDGIHINRKRCNLCGKCVEECLAGALTITGEKMSVEEVFSVVKKDRDYYKNSGGGVTVSGGEILRQPDFVAALLERCQEEGIHTCADTSGYGESEAMEKILAYSNLVYFDLKHMNPMVHKRLVGKTNEKILHNLALVVKKEIPLVVRVPLIPGYNNSDENMMALGRMVADLTSDAPVHLLPYHRYGISKYKSLDMEYTLKDIEPLTQDEIERAKTIVESFGLKCEVAK